jgi:ABC-type polysaccharide/polyol phosphate transport system ATPase subunit
MSDPAIRVSGLGKRYLLGRESARYQALHGYHTLREALSGGAAEVARGIAFRLGRNRRPAATDNSIWALRDVTLDVQRGEVVGMIGGNGAGKSTLLKILSRVTKPTTGWVELSGRVGSLLEVGTGFHAELTGRENIYLSGAILGMKHAEIRRKFDQIVEFAEVARFIDTPVKRYSSGMYLRLAFAVAAHLEPEILLVDEVLAVGDASFQKKCLGKMGDVAQEGRTVLFVSHNMDAIRRLCPHSVLLEHGQLVAQGDSASVVARYLSRFSDRPKPNEWIDLSSAQRLGTGEARFMAIRYSSLNNAVACRAYPDGVLEFDVVIASDAPRKVGSMAVTIKTQSGTKLINADIVSQGQMLPLREGRNNIRLRIEAIHLNPGVYVVGLWVGHSFGKALDHVEAALEIEVVHAESRGLGMTPLSDGLVPCRFQWLQAQSNEDGPGAPSRTE